MPGKQLRAKLVRFRPEPALPRPSYPFCIISGQAYLFGGENKPRQPVDVPVHTSSLTRLPSSSAGAVESSSINTLGEAPTARVGHTVAPIEDSIYTYGGPNGVDPKPLEEHGRVWCFSTSNRAWSAWDPPAGSNYPEGRSYHSATSEEASGNLFIHAGCPAGGRQTDLWKFSVESSRWTQLPSVPAPAREGPGFTFALGTLWRYGGFDGKHELGGQLDYLDVKAQSGSWKPVGFAEGACPGGRSVIGLHAINTGEQDYLIALFGKRRFQSSSLGHAGAGVFWGDIWALALNKQGEPASHTWSRCKVDGESPDRGWLASDCLDQSTIIVYGGFNGRNEREADGHSIIFSETSL